MNVSECHPYYFQMLCHVLWEISQEGKVMTRQHIEEAIDILISRESSAYIAIWEGLTAKQKNLMVALAKEEYPEVFSNRLRPWHYATSVTKLIDQHRIHSSGQSLTFIPSQLLA